MHWISYTIQNSEVINISIPSHRNWWNPSWGVTRKCLGLNLDWILFHHHSDSLGPWSWFWDSAANKAQEFSVWSCSNSDFQYILIKCISQNVWFIPNAGCDYWWSGKGHFWMCGVPVHHCTVVILPPIAKHCPGERGWFFSRGIEASRFLEAWTLWHLHFLTIKYNH